MPTTKYTKFNLSFVSSTTCRWQFPPNYLVPIGPPNPMIVVQPNQIKNYANEMVNKIKENQEKLNMENELKQLKEKLNDEKFKRLET